MDKEYIISAIGGNRPGVVAELTKHIYLSGIRVKNSSMTLLGDHFSLMIHIVSQEEILKNMLVNRLDEIEQQTEIRTHIFAAPEKIPGSGKHTKPQYAIRVRGENRSGILYRVSSFFAQRGINILEMNSRVEKMPQRDCPFFLMYIRIEVPEKMDNNEFLVNLEYLASELHESLTLTRVSQGG